MNKQRDLLPWILGALSASAVAVAITAVSSNKTAPPAPTPMVAAQSTPAPVTHASAPPPVPLDAVVAAAAPQLDPTLQQPPTQAQVAPESPAPSGQIWECMTKGVKTFSNNPCGDKSTLLEVGPINTMNPTPVHYARAYAPEPRYAPAYAESDNATQESYSDPVSAESGGNSYTIIRGVGFVARRRPEHPHHRPTPNHHNSGPMPRRY